MFDVYTVAAGNIEHSFDHLVRWPDPCWSISQTHTIFIAFHRAVVRRRIYLAVGLRSLRDLFTSVKGRETQSETRVWVGKKETKLPKEAGKDREKRRRKGVNVPSPLLKVPWWMCLADDRSTPQPHALSLSCTSRHTRERTYTPISHCTESGPSLEVAFSMNAAPTTSRRPRRFPFYSVSFCVILAPR